MQKNSKLLSIGGCGVPMGPRCRVVVRNFMMRRRLTPEEWVNQTYAGGIEKIRRAITEKLATLPSGSSMRAYVEKLQSLPDERLLDEIYSRAHANRERDGCPPYRTLIEMASRAPSIDDPDWKHITRCHP